MSHRFRCKWRPRLTSAKRWLGENGGDELKAYRSAMWLRDDHPGIEDAMAYIYWRMAGNGRLPECQPVPGERYDKQEAL